ncbi:MAG: hypothetical protein AAF682_15715 [Planctomycetota bacterium]
MTHRHAETVEITPRRPRSSLVNWSSLVKRSRQGALQLALVALCGTSAIAHDGAKFEPPDGMILHGGGQTIGGSADDPDYLDYIQSLGPTSNILPLVNKYYYTIAERKTVEWWANPTPQNFQAILTDKILPLRTWLNAQKASGAMPEVSISFSPFTYQGTTLVPDQVLPQGALDMELAELAKTLAAFNAPMFVRPGFEAPEKGYTQGAAYIDSYRYIVDTLRDEGVDAAFIQCAGPNSGDDLLLATPQGEPLWYAGDAWVDWLGFDPLKPSDLLPGNIELNALLIFADFRKKPVFISETSASNLPSGGICSPGDAWADWFVPFLAMLNANPRIKAFNYINWDWEAHGFTGWGNAKISCSATVTANWIAELSNTNRYIHRGSTALWDHPFFDNGRLQLPAAGSVQVLTRNLDPGALALSCHLSPTKLVQPGPLVYCAFGPCFLVEIVGAPFPPSGQSLFIDGPTELCNGAPVTGPTHTETVSIAGASAGETYYYQQLYIDGAGALKVTHALQLDVVP